MRYTYPAIFEQNELGGYSVWFPDLPECYTDGDDLENAIDMAAEAMSLVIESYIDHARSLPKPSLAFQPDDDARLAFVSCDVDTSDRLVSAHAAAGLLGVSDARVRQLIGSGKLQGRKQGRDNYVYLWSVKDRLASPRLVGRPVRRTVA